MSSQSLVVKNSLPITDEEDFEKIEAALLNRTAFNVQQAAIALAGIQRRILVRQDWFRAFNQCLDGLGGISTIPGAGMDGLRMPENIRTIVKALLEKKGIK